MNTIDEETKLRIAWWSRYFQELAELALGQPIAFRLPIGPGPLEPGGVTISMPDDREIPPMVRRQIHRRLRVIDRQMEDLQELKAELQEMHDRLAEAPV